MARDNGSCFKKLLVGCGCLTVMTVLLALVAALFVNRVDMEPADMETITLEENVGGGSEQALNLPESQSNDAPRAVIVSIEVSAAQLTIIPDAEPGQVRLDGEYDRANFDLRTEVQEKNGVKTYTLEFKPLRLINISSDDTDNELVLHLPRNTPMQLDLEFDKGYMDADLGGLALDELNAELSMGKFDFRVSKPNPITAKDIEFETSMGDLNLSDFQNLNARRGSISASMGAARFYNSGNLTTDTLFDLDANMGEIYIQAPENAAIRTDLECKIGDTSTLSRAGDENDPVLELKGSCLMGGIRVTAGQSKPKLEHVLLNVWAEQGVESMLEFYTNEIKKKPDSYQFDRHSLRGLGYKIMEMGNPEDALAIFEANAKEHPDYERSWRALGAVHIELGNFEKAIEHLGKAIEINPTYESAMRLMEKAVRKMEQRSREEL